jgi:demethylmenaquinone methyltransferase/2-methoxy-6-polyprenyl-1,4-benzoquinol methylase/ArsR family transcriptional regulator
MSEKNAFVPDRPATVGVERLLAGLEAAGEITRLRVLSLLCAAELTVSELVAILGQSQPRVSRHLKLLVEAGLAERRREGAWGFFRIAEGDTLARDLVARLDRADPVLVADRARLEMTREARRRQAAAYFAQRAPDWDHIRTLHAPEEQVEAAILALLGPKPIRAMLDIGTGTGRMLELIAPNAQRVVGLDQSAAMLSVARARIEERGLSNTQLRQGDIYAAPIERGAYDLVVIHQVLHFLDDVPRAIGEAARALSPGGRLLIVDFMAHEEESLRQDYAHRHLGFTEVEMEAWLAAANLGGLQNRQIVPPPGQSGALTVGVWLAHDMRVLTAEAAVAADARYTVEIA